MKPNVMQVSYYAAESRPCVTMLTIKEDLDRLAALIVIVWGLLLPFCAFSDSTHPVFLFILSVDIFPVSPVPH